MNILLLAINSKYIHSNPAVYSIKAYAAANGVNASDIDIAEYTINHRIEEIVRGVYARKPDVLMVSTYIWNIEYVKAVIKDFNKICPDVPIWLGGPEASYSAEALMNELSFIKGIMIGEGEAVFAELAKVYNVEFPKLTDIIFEGVKGIMFRNDKGVVIATKLPTPLNMDDIPFAYEDLTPFKNRIIYYESSRGCPFGCSYCLSSVEKSLRFRSLDKVFAELKHFIDNKVPQVKFVDRTFNAKHDRVIAILNFLKENDNGITNFHFEVSADLLRDDEIELMSTLRPGLIQLEIGVQSTNPKTLRAINRTADMDKLRRNVDAVYKMRNIHQHLDLIAGLPYEDLASFKNSFRDVYSMKPDQLQLGFLKVLSGTQMSAESDEYGIVYSDRTPYEVLQTNWLSYDDILVLKGVEEMVEIYYNSGQFKFSIEYLERFFDNPFWLYERLYKFYETSGIAEKAHSRMDRYNVLLDFYKGVSGDEQCGIFEELLLFDLYLRDNLKKRPDFATDISGDKELVRQFYMAEEHAHKYLSATDYEGFNGRQLAKMTHLERYEYNPYTYEKEQLYILFDYQVRNPLSYEARTVILKESELKFGNQ